MSRRPSPVMSARRLMFLRMTLIVSATIDGIGP